MTKKAPIKKESTAKKAVTRPPTAREKLDAFGIDAVIEAILHPKPQYLIAQDIGVSAGSLIAWIAADSDRSVRAREARAQTALMWDDKATHVIEEAKDQFELAKAKELAHHYRWRAAKIAPREYGDKVDLNHGGQENNPIQVKTKVVMVPLKMKAETIIRQLTEDENG